MRSKIVRGGIALALAAAIAAGAPLAAHADTGVIDSDTRFWLSQEGVDHQFSELTRKGQFVPSDRIEVEHALPASEKPTRLARVGGALFWGVGLSAAAVGAEQLWQHPDVQFGVSAIEREFFGIQPPAIDTGSVYYAPRVLAPGAVSSRFWGDSQGLSIKHTWGRDMQQLAQQTGGSGGLVPAKAIVDCVSVDGKYRTVEAQIPGYTWQSAWPSQVAGKVEDYFVGGCGADEQVAQVVAKPMGLREAMNYGPDEEISQWALKDWNDFYPARYQLADWPVWIAKPVPNADKTYRVEDVCVDPQGGRTAVSVSTPGTITDFEMPQCAPGSFADTRTIYSKPNGSPTELVEVVTRLVNDGRYPECVGELCLMTVKVDGQVCGVGVPGCLDWTERVITAPNTLECLYGPYQVAVSECYPLERAFEPKVQPATHLNTDGDPRTKSETHPGWDPGSKPEAGTKPGTSPGTGTSPGAGTESETTRENCTPQGAGEIFNPVLWVVKPVKCALEWAFVPSQTVLAEVGASTAASWAASPPGRLQGVVEGWQGEFPNMSGCEGPRVEFSWSKVGGTYYPLSACEGPLADIAPKVRLIGTIALFAGAGFAITRYLAGTIGYRGLGKGED